MRKERTYRIISEHVVILLPSPAAPPDSGRQVLHYRQVVVDGIERALEMLTHFARDVDCTEATLFTEDWRQLIQIPRSL